MGLFVNIEAIDGVGKTTQGPLVSALLVERGISVARLAFPDRPARGTLPSGVAQFATGVLINRFLDSGLRLIDGNDPLFRRPGVRDLPPEAKADIAFVVREKLVQMLYSINRREGYEALVAALDAHDVVLVERWLSAHTYGVAGGVGRPQIAAIEGELPEPDLTVLLDLDATVARARRDMAHADRYEQDFALQSKVRELYVEIARIDNVAAEAEQRPRRVIRVDGSLPAETIAGITADIIMRRLAGDPSAPLLEA